MGTVDKVGGGGYIPPESWEGDEEVIIGNLPLEIFERILSYLDGLDSQSSVVVSNLWKEASIDAAKHKEFELIKKFIKKIANHLEEGSNPEQVVKLLNIVEGGSKILNSVNLIQVKSSINELRKEVLNVLADLEDEKLEGLEDLFKNKKNPESFENVFSLAKLYKKMDDASHSTDVFDDELKEIAVGLAKYGDVEKIREMTNRWPDDDQIAFCTLIIQELINDNDNIAAAKVAEIMSNAEAVELSYHMIINKLLNDENIENIENIDNSIYLAHKLPIDKKNKEFGYIASRLARAGFFEKCKEVINYISDNKKKDEVLEGRILQLAREGNVESAREFAEILSDDVVRERVLKRAKLA